MIKLVMAIGSLLLLFLMLAGCAPQKPELPQPTGAWVHLNPDKYPSDQNDITHAPKL